jgi:SAM-dependent methyltransferase
VKDTATEPARGEAQKNIYDRADVYEAIYRGRGKDYESEATTAVGLIRERKPKAMSLLDVGCGTGSHLRYFADAFDHAEGMDLNEAMIAVARTNLPTVPVRQGDMRQFDLRRRFDALTCMFSAIGNISGTDELDATLQSFTHHLNPGGVLVLEPWWFPENFIPQYIGGDVVQVDGRTIARISRSVRQGDASRMEVHYVVAGPESGIWHFTDTHVMALYHRHEYEAAFARAGASVEYVELGNGSPGLFVGVLDTARLSHLTPHTP